MSYGYEMNDKQMWLDHWKKFFSFFSFHYGVLHVCEWEFVQKKMRKKTCLSPGSTLKKLCHIFFIISLRREMQMPSSSCSRMSLIEIFASKFNPFIARETVNEALFILNILLESRFRRTVELKLKFSCQNKFLKVSFSPGEEK